MIEGKREKLLSYPEMTHVNNCDDRSVALMF